MVESVEIVAVMTLCKAMIATVVAPNETITMPATAITSSDCARMTTAAAAHLRAAAAAHYFRATAAAPSAAVTTAMAAAVTTAVLHECHCTTGAETAFQVGRTCRLSRPPHESR
jgi:hypothetical protein